MARIVVKEKVTNHLPSSAPIIGLFRWGRITAEEPDVARLGPVCIYGITYATSEVEFK